VNKPFVLASGSSGRLRLLRDAGIDPEVVVSGVDETTEEPTTAEKVAVLAQRKAAAVAALRPDALVLGCDSLLDLDGVSYGKPGSAAAATALWQRLAGQAGTLYTGHCLVSGDRLVSGVTGTVVRFGTPSEAEIAAYVATGEPLLMAGGFSLDGRGAAFVDRIDGDPGTVIGLSLPLLRRLLADAGVALTSLWRPYAGGETTPGGAPGPGTLAGPGPD
jgi:septum formation protein